MNWFAYVNRFEVLSVREQCLTGATVLVFCISAMQILVIDPVIADLRSADQKLSNLQSINEAKRKQLVESAFGPAETRARRLNVEINAIQSQLSQEQKNLEQYTSSLVPAKKMPDLLQALLQQGALVSLQNLAPVPLIEASLEGGEPPFQLYRHGIELRLRGDFHSLRRYLESIEQQTRKLLWLGVRLETTESGASEMALRIGTLSMDNAWLGV